MGKYSQLSICKENRINNIFGSYQYFGLKTECNHTGQNRDRDRDQEQMGCMNLCRSFHITPEPGQGPRYIVPHCSGSALCTAQC